MVHRKQILEAAERVFARKGFEHATVVDVAKEADFSVGALYNFFPSKEALFGEVMKKIAAEFEAEFQKVVVSASNPVEAIGGVVELRLRLMEAHAGFFRRLVEMRPAGRAFPDEAIPKECREQYAAYLRKLAGLFATAMADGWLRPMDARYAALTLEGSINAYSAFWARENIHLPLEERRRLLLQHCVEPMGMSGEKRKDA